MKGKNALITGSAAGLGYVIAEALARAGCNIVLHGIEPAESVLPGLTQLQQQYTVKVVYVRADLAEADAAEHLVAQARELLGGMDILVNNAVTRDFSPIAEFSVQSWDRAIAVNLSAAFHTVRLCLPTMRERSWGRIFNMTSVYGHRATLDRIDYVTTKTALIGLTRAVALETINQGITCNAICPGAVLTPTSAARIGALMEKTGLDRERATERFLQGKQPGLRFIDPAHVADLMVFLCGEAGNDITGTVMPIERGWLAS